jgi:hypothetical protein
MDRFRSIAIWFLQFLLAALFAIQGIMKLTGSSAWISRFNAWGYPDHFYLVVGLAELLGAIALLIPRLAKIRSSNADRGHGWGGRYSSDPSRTTGDDDARAHGAAGNCYVPTPRRGCTFITPLMGRTIRKWADLPGDNSWRKHQYVQARTCSNFEITFNPWRFVWIYVGKPTHKVRRQRTHEEA